MIYYTGDIGLGGNEAASTLDALGRKVCWREEAFKVLPCPEVFKVQ